MRLSSFQNGISLPVLPDRSWQTRFSAGLPPSHPENGQGKEPTGQDNTQKTFLQRLIKKSGKWLLVLAPVSNLLGGPMLIASSALPDKLDTSPLAIFSTAPEASSPHNLPEILASLPPYSQETALPKAVETPMGEFSQLTPVELKETEVDLTGLKERLKKLGWDLCSLGFLGGAISGLAMGYVSRQPSMVLNSMSNMGAIPFLLMYPDSFVVKAAIALSTAPWLSGYANIYRNQFQLKPGEKPREFDMAPLFFKESLTRLNPEELQGASAWKRARTRGKYSLEMFRYFLQDQWLVLTDISKSMAGMWRGGKALAKQPKQKITDGANQLREAYRFMQGKTTEAPRILQPSVFQNQCAAFLLYAGSLPILFLMGSAEAVNAAGKTLFTMGSALANFPMWALGFNRKDKNLILGIPLMTFGTFTMDTTWGIGAMRLGEAGFMNFIRKEVNRAQEKSESESKPSGEGAIL